MKIKPILRGLAATAYRALCKGLMVARPVPREQAVVFGKPDFEENSLAVVGELARSYDGRIILLYNDLDQARHCLTVASGAIPFPVDRVRLVKRTPLRAAWLQSVSRIVLFSTPIYSSARPTARRIHVNLWHGTGPKWSSSANFRHRIGAGFLASTAFGWAHDTMLGLGMDPARTRVVTGNPRQDFLLHAPAEHQLRSLGVDPGKPLVLWAPTYRRTKRIGAGRLNDGEQLSDGQARWSNRSLASDLAEVAARHSVQLLVKPHPEDADTFVDSGVTVLTSEQIWATGITLHQFLGAADAVISDYSSIWVDFLASGRSIALLCPDIEAYTRARSLNRPKLGDVGERLFLDTAADADEFFREVAAGRIYRPDALAQLMSDIGFVHQHDRTRALLREVGVLGPEETARVVQPHSPV